MDQQTTETEIIRESYCSLCKRQFSDKQSFRRHVQEVHVKKSVGPVHEKKSVVPVHEKKNAHICSICDKILATAFGLRRHVEEIHESQNPVECPRCEKKFKSESGLKLHIKSLISSNRSNDCSECDYKAAITCDLGAKYLVSFFSLFPQNERKIY